MVLKQSYLITLKSNKNILVYKKNDYTKWP